MKITIELDDSDVSKLAWTYPPKQLNIHTQDNRSKYDNCDINTPSSSNSGWIDGKDVCATCPNRPGGPNNKSGFCMCAIPSMFGPNRITC